MTDRLESYIFKHYFSRASFDYWHWTKHSVSRKQSLHQDTGGLHTERCLSAAQGAPEARLLLAADVIGVQAIRAAALATKILWYFNRVYASPEDWRENLQREQEHHSSNPRTE